MILQFKGRSLHQIVTKNYFGQMWDIVSKIRELLTAIKKDPFKGIGKPEPLKFSLQGCWCRRISAEHLLVYRIIGNKDRGQRCTIIQCRFHFDDN